jgi:hypothetical protein
MDLFISNSFEKVNVENRGMIPIGELKKGYRVYTGQGSAQLVKDVIHTGSKPIAQVHTQSGYLLDGSKEHPILIAGNSGTQFNKIGDLVIGSYACINRELVLGSNIILPKNNSKDITVPFMLDSKLAWLLGAIIGNGYYKDKKNSTINLTSKDAEILSYFEEICKNYKLNIDTCETKNRKCCRNRDFREWLYDVGLDYTTTKNKKVPDILFRSTIQARGAFLRGLFDTYGSIGKNTCRFVTSSQTLALAIIFRILRSLMPFKPELIIVCIISSRILQENGIQSLFDLPFNLPIVLFSFSCLYSIVKPTILLKCFKDVLAILIIYELCFLLNLQIDTIPNDNSIL